MVVRNGVETKNVTSKDFDLTSASASRVLLPCRAWGEMRLEMMNAALGMMSEEELHRVCDAHMKRLFGARMLKCCLISRESKCVSPHMLLAMLFLDSILMLVSQLWQMQPKLQVFWMSSFHVEVAA